MASEQAAANGECNPRFGLYARSDRPEEEEDGVSGHGGPLTRSGWSSGASRSFHASRHSVRSMLEPFSGRIQGSSLSIGRWKLSRHTSASVDVDGSQGVTMSKCTIVTTQSKNAHEINSVRRAWPLGVFLVLLQPYIEWTLSHYHTTLSDVKV